jgi:hypothetical protein
LATNSVGIPYALAISLALHAAPALGEAKCLSAINP